MEFVYPYNVHDNGTTYYNYYYDPGQQMVEMTDSFGMMSVSPMSPTYIPSDQNNNSISQDRHLQPAEYDYIYEDTDVQYQKLDIINNAFIIVNPDEFPFIDLPYIHSGKPFNGKKQKFNKKGFKAYKDFKDKVEDTEESTVKLVPPEISYDRDQLMNIAKLPLSQATPDAWPSIAKKLPRLVRREGPTANIIIKEVRAIKKQEELNVAKMTKKPEEPQVLSLWINFYHNYHKYFV